MCANARGDNRKVPHHRIIDIYSISNSEYYFEFVSV